MPINVLVLLTFLLGGLVGWVGHWLLELFLFRQRHLEQEHKVQALEDDLKARELQLEQARQEVETLQAQLAQLAVTPTGRRTPATEGDDGEVEEELGEDLVEQAVVDGEDVEGMPAASAGPGEA